MDTPDAGDALEKAEVWDKSLQRPPVASTVALVCDSLYGRVGAASPSSSDSRRRAFPGIAGQSVATGSTPPLAVLADDGKSWNGPCPAIGIGALHSVADGQTLPGLCGFQPQLC